MELKADDRLRCGAQKDIDGTAEALGILPKPLEIADIVWRPTAS